MTIPTNLAAMAALLLATVAAPAVADQPPAAAPELPSPEAVVRGFLRDVRSGKDPDAASRYFAPRIAAHQVTAENETTIIRSPADYAAHVRDFLVLYGRFTLQIEELIARNDRVYVRWRQVGRHLGSINGEPPTGAPLTELTAAVYRVDSGRIAEYWIQSDRKGLDLQLERASQPQRP